MEDFCVKNLNGNDMQVLFDSNMDLFKATMKFLQRSNKKGTNALLIPRSTKKTAVKGFRPADNLMMMDFKANQDDPNDFYFQPSSHE